MKIISLTITALFCLSIQANESLTEYQQGVLSGYLQTRTIAVNCIMLSKDKNETIDCMIKNKGKIDFKKNKQD